MQGIENEAMIALLHLLQYKLIVWSQLKLSTWNYFQILKLGELFYFLVQAAANLYKKEKS